MAERQTKIEPTSRIVERPWALPCSPAFLRRAWRSLPVAFVAIATSAVAHAPAPASGASRLPDLASPRVHPEALTLFAHLARTGRTFPTFRRNETFERTGRLPVVVRWTSPPSAEKRRILATEGVALERDTPIASGAWLANVNEAGLHALAADPEVARVSVDLFREALLPLDDSLEETRAEVARRAAIAKEGKELDGTGVVIADIDAPVWIHHPAFFRADGGTFAWIDVDGDERLTPGTDGIDLDGSGTIEPNEVLQHLRSTATSRAGTVIEEHEGFAPDVDYLYLDTNGNGARDHGSGFDESTPAYGEPLFVFDDANHDLATQTSERVIQLKTSKIKAASAAGATFVRGKSGPTGLVRYPSARATPLPPTIYHGTAVSSILAGGQPGISRWLGIAPGADLLIADHGSLSGPIRSVQWALEQGANVILTEYSQYTGVSLDGSSEDERILDAASDRGVVPVSPAGNLAAGGKHRTITLTPGVQEIALGNDVETRHVALSLHHRGGARKITLELKTPTGTTGIIPEAAPAGVNLDDGTVIHATTQTTPRGTHERFVQLLSEVALPKGAYVLRATLDAGEPLEVDAFVSDELMAWTRGFSFSRNTPSRTICSPATSDETIAVAAYVLHDGPDFFADAARGQVASTSSRGPRLDGAAGIDIAAPNNPLSAAPPAGADADGIAWTPLGGTSCAGPHVAAAAALLVQAFPRESAHAIKKRLLDAATPIEGGETAAGRGKLDVARALGAEVVSGDPPEVTIELVTPPLAGSDATLRVTARDDEPPAALTARWDLDYDGAFDTGWLPLANEQRIPLAAASLGARIGVKVEVRDGQGNVNGATTILDVAAPTSTDPAPAIIESCACRTTGARVPLGDTRAALAALAFSLAWLVRARVMRARSERPASHVGSSP